MENTATGGGGYWNYEVMLCSACKPEGKWHNEFGRAFFPKDMYKTNRTGNLEHKESGELARISEGSKTEINPNNNG